MQYNSGRYRVIKGWFGRAVLQVWYTPPNHEFHRWVTVKFMDAHTMLQGTEV